MADEKRLIELETLIDNIDWDNDLQKWALRGDPEEIPTVDAVEVVRCKDCEHYEAERVGIPGGDPRRVYECGYCYHWKYEAGDSPNSVDADDFCSYGERRTNEPEKPV